MSTQHTPGQWYACCLDGLAHYVFGPNGDETICGLNHNDPKEPTFDPHSGVVTVDQRRANARLIAAAPELLEALQYAEALATAWVAYWATSPAYGNGTAHPEHVSGLEKIAQAIAKAKGEQP